MITNNRWFKVLLSGGIILMALALTVSLLTPFVFSIAGSWWGAAPGTPDGMMGPGMMSGMMGGGMMGGGGFSSPFGWLVALPRLLFALGILLVAGAGIVWLAQAPLMQDRSVLPPRATQGE